jgi:Polysaccharide deacetylase
VVSQMGQVRRVGQSSYNGMRHMGPAELRDLLARGWGVGNHSWSHGAVTAETADLEVGQARVALEEAIGAPVTVYCAPGSNSNMNPGALDACRRYGYLGAMSITDALNRPQADDLLWLNRTFLHHQGYGPFFSAFDPFRNLAYARREGGWVIDYLHCPLETPVHPNKDCSAGQLQERLETVRGEGGDDVWLTPVEAPQEYRYLRRQVRIEPGPPVPGETPGAPGQSEADASYLLSAPDLPPAVTRRTVTLALSPETRGAAVDGIPVPLSRRAGRLLLDVDLSAPRRLTLLSGSGPHS